MQKRNFCFAWYYYLCQRISEMVEVVKERIDK